MKCLECIQGRESLHLDQLWFQSLGYERVFVARLVTRALLFVGVGSFAFAFVYVNVRLAMRGFAPRPRNP